jgi:NAD-dependent dihydropyrimidine dehydrogenase PreA subunit
MSILHCRCANASVIPEAVGAVVSKALAGRPDVVTVDDLCACAANRDPRLAAWAADGQLTVAACHPRAVRWLFRWAGSSLDEARVRFVDLRRETAPEFSAAPAGGAEAPMAGGSALADAWPPWFPVIDYDRCRQCRQCLSFCLFGVYALAPDGKVVVANPRQCKNNCPACSRICPDVAIMFPKLPEAESPLNGDAITDEAAIKARARINAGEILGADVHAALARRREESARRRLKRPAAPPAEPEREAP